MTLKDIFLAELDMEMATTRTALARVPESKLDWSPHPKSWSMAELATHIANLPNWTGMTVNQDSLDLNPPDGISEDTDLARWLEKGLSFVLALPSK